MLYFCEELGILICLSIQSGEIHTMSCPVGEGWASYPTKLLLPLLQSRVLKVGQLPHPGLNFPGPLAAACGHVISSHQLSASLWGGVLNG